VIGTGGGLLRGRPLHFHTTSFNGLPAYTIDDHPTTVELLLRRRTLAPLAVEFRSRTVSGYSRVTSTTPLKRAHKATETPFRTRRDSS
jgi:hypothetical protein